MTTELTQPSSAPKALSAGQILRQAREQQNLTVAQVAQQLNLGKSLIEDLELDQVDAKLSSTFVRGYLRSYAKLLKLPAQQVLDAYSSNSKGLHQIPSLTRSFSKRTATEATENRFMWVTYFVIFVFIVLLVVGFWQSRFGSSASGTALPMAQTDETMLASEAAQPAQSSAYEQTTPQNEIPVTQLDHSPTATDSSASPATLPQAALATDVPVVLPGQEQATTVPATTQGPENLLPEPTPAQTQPQEQQPAAVVTDTAVQPQIPTSQIPTSQIPTSSTERPQTDTSTVQPVPEVTNSDVPAVVGPVTTAESLSSAQTDAAANATISLSLNAECWVDVVDATGKRLVFGSRQPGEQLNLRGVAPVKVLLGNAAAATLSFNGEAIDLSGYPTGRVARLTLGQN
jgi:cytoskeleton protein RodZ